MNTNGGVMSYAFSPRSASMACKIIKWFHCLMKLDVHSCGNDAMPAIDLRGLLRTASHRSQRPTAHAFLQKDTLELFGSGCTLSDVHKRLAGKAQRTQSHRALGRLWPLTQETAGRRLLIRSCWSFWVRHSFNCCLGPWLYSEAGNSMQSRFHKELHV